MHQVADSPWVVLKFGGTSVSTREAWQNIAGRLRACEAEGLRPVLVHSALSGVTDELERLIQRARRDDVDEGVWQIASRHEKLAASLGGELPEGFQAQLAETGRLLSGIRLLGEASPRIAARVMASGELLAGFIAEVALRQAGLACRRMDPRELLSARAVRYSDRESRYLSAECDSSPDPGLSERLLAETGVILTQGYVASGADGETVVLGRGGSDTSAACLAAKLRARRLEIWSDVPGMYTADPRAVTGARLLRRLEYSEAQEISTMGGKVLHPRCINPLRSAGIPLVLASTERPDISGTLVSAAASDTTPRVKAVSAKKGVILVSMETSGMWHHVGFLADAFACFRKHGLSVDLVSTSETSVTVSLDTTGTPLQEQTLDRLVKDLEEICSVTLIRDCAAVSLIGHRIRAILHRLGPVLELFEEHRIHLLSQAASDLNFTVVVDEDQAGRLVQQLHRIVIEDGEDDSLLGPAWESLSTGHAQVSRSAPAWWVRKRDQLLAMAPQDGAAYVYDLESVRRAALAMREMSAVDRLLYAVKANWNPDVLRCLRDTGLDFECVSPGEIDHLLALFPDLDPGRILFTPNFAPRSEYEYAMQRGAQVTLDSLYPLEHWSGLFRGRDVFIRLDMGRGRGHHPHVRTAGVHSKFGIPLFELDRLETLARDAGVRIVGLHSHAGSGVLSLEHWPGMAWEMAEVARRFPDVRVLDLGGGLGVPERSGGRALDLAALDQKLAEFVARWSAYEIWLEPGRYLVAGAGVLLSRVTQQKGKGANRFIGLNTGMNSLIRPMLYGAYHEIVNLSRLDAPAAGPASIVGPVCETGDTLGTERALPESHEGDVILVANAGAYGRVMSSRYNMRAPAEELTLTD